MRGTKTLVRRDSVQAVRRLVPVRLLPQLVKRRVDRLWAIDDFRRSAEDQMRFLLECTERAPEIESLARPYAEDMMLRNFLRWHPKAITRQRVKGIEWLTTERDQRRGVVLSFAHHARYDGLFASIAAHGPTLTSVMVDDMLRADAPIAFRQHRYVCGLGTELVPSSVGTDALVEMLGRSATLCIASDFPGRTPVTFLGRRVAGSFGAARIASLADSPVVLVTTERDATGPFLQVHEPLEPHDFADPADLLAEILRRHGDAMLAWPEAVEAPAARFGVLEDAS